MPQPLHGDNTGAMFEPHPLKKRPEAAAAMANALAAWNLFEWDMTMAYSIAMGFYLPGIQGWAPPCHPLAFQIFDSLSSLNSRLDLLEKCIALVAAPALDEFVKIRPRIRKLAGKRAEIAHGIWGINDAYPEDLILSRTGRKNVRWNAKDFDVCADQFATLRLDFRTVDEAICEAAKSRDGLRPSPIPV